MKTVFDLNIGETARIKSFVDLEKGARLLSMGLYPSNEITLVRKSLFGGSLYLKMKNQCLALRLSEAKLVEVE